MTTFLVLFRADEAVRERLAEATPRERAEGMRAWMIWAGKAGDAVVDLGAPLAPSSDGADQDIGGFSILQADSPDELDSVLSDHPHTMMGGTIEVHEFLAMPAV
jgi:hypothetical protein